MNSLYNIQHEHIAITNDLLENGGELTPELEMALAINRQDLFEKAEGYALRIREFSTQADAITAEADRLYNRASSFKKTADRLKETISSAMQQFDVEKIEGKLITLSFRKSKVVVIHDDSQIPQDYFVQKAPEISKTLISDAIKAGTNVPGAEMQEKKNLQIK